MPLPLIASRLGYPTGHHIWEIAFNRSEVAIYPVSTTRTSVSWGQNPNGVYPALKKSGSETDDYEYRFASIHSHDEQTDTTNALAVICPTVSQLLRSYASGGGDTKWYCCRSSLPVTSETG